jgi:peptidoglycan hydrolase-like protein with peptidoglycan-binding domain
LETQLLNLLIRELKVVLLQAQAQGMILTPAEIAFLNGSPMTALTPSAITRNLTVGSRGSDVVTLQTFLISQAKGPAASALGAAGATGYFGQLTKAALAEYQAAVGIAPPQGYFGPITRAYLKSIGF